MNGFKRLLIKRNNLNLLFTRLVIRNKSTLEKINKSNEIIKVENLTWLRCFNYLSVLQTFTSISTSTYFSYKTLYLNNILIPMEGLGLTTMVSFTALQLYFVLFAKNLVTNLKINDKETIKIETFNVLTPSTILLPIKNIIPVENKDIIKRVVKLKTTESQTFNLYLSPTSIKGSEQQLRSILQKNQIL